jgi:hypothetical protein
MLYPRERLFLKNTYAIFLAAHCQSNHGKKTKRVSILAVIYISNPVFSKYAEDKLQNRRATNAL